MVVGVGALVNLVYYLIVKAGTGRRGGVLGGGRYQKGIFLIWQVCPMIICCPPFS